MAEETTPTPEATAAPIIQVGKASFWTTKAGIGVVIGIVIFILMIIVGVYFYEQGKDQIKQAALPANDSTGDNLTDAQVSQMAASMHADMSGISLFADHDGSVYTPILALGNYDFVRLYNIYNTQYQTADGKDMYDMINACWALPGSEWSGIKQSLISKLAANNITS